MIKFLSNYVSLFEREWFLGLLRLFVDIICIAILLFLVIAVLYGIFDWLFDL